MYNLASVLDRHAGRWPGREVLVCGEARLTNAQLLTRVQALASGLLELGIGRGDVVGLLLHNCAEFMELVFAVNRVGAIFLPLNYRLAPPEWEFILGHAGAVAIATEPEFAAAVAELAPRVPGLARTILLHGTPGASPPGDSPAGGSEAETAGGWTRYESLVSANLGRRPPAADMAADEVQRLMYTSGTTSRPKGVPLTYQNVIYKNLGQIIELKLTQEDVTLVCGPLYHVGGHDLPALAVWHAGGRLVLLRTFDPAAVLRAIEEERITNLWLAPAMMIALLPVAEKGHDGADFDTSSVRLITGGGEKTPETLVRRVLAAFPNAWFADAYGLTETASGDTFLDSDHTLAKLGSVGRPLPHLSVRVVDERGADAAPGTSGEVVLRGPKVFSGYWRDEEATARAIRDGWFHTGDVGRLDADGYLYIEDRKKDMILSGGENIATPEVERVLYEHPAVVEAAVVAMPHQRWGEVPRAFVVLGPGETATPQQIQEFCRARLAKFKVPARIDLVAALPRTPSGKVLKRVLRGWDGTPAGSGAGAQA